MVTKEALRCKIIDAFTKLEATMPQLTRPLIDKLIPAMTGCSTVILLVMYIFEVEPIKAAVLVLINIVVFGMLLDQYRKLPNPE
jgi:hypothetical protein